MLTFTTTTQKCLASARNSTIEHNLKLEFLLAQPRLHEEVVVCHHKTMAVPTGSGCKLQYLCEAREWSIWIRFRKQTCLKMKHKMASVTSNVVFPLLFCLCMQGGCKAYGSFVRHFTFCCAQPSFM